MAAAEEELRVNIDELTRQEKALIAAEQEIRESRDLMRAYLDHSYDAIFIHDDSGKILDVNATALRLYRVTRKEALGYSIADFSGPACALDKAQEHWERVLAGEDRFFPWQARRPHDGSVFDVEVYLTQITIAGRQIILGNIRDITERKRAEEEIVKKNKELHAVNEQLAAAEEELKGQFDALAESEQMIRESEERFRTIIHSLQFGIVIIDAQNHTILEANPKAFEMIGGTPESVAGLACHRFICPAEQGRCPVTDLGQTVDSSERVLLNLHGEKIPILKSVIKTMLGGREVLIESFINITDRKLAEDTLLKVNQKLNVLSQLTRQDLTTQIFVLNSYLEMAKKQATGQDGIIKNIVSGERTVRLIKEITEFTKDYQNMGEKPPKWQNVKLAILFGLSHISIGEIRHSLETENLEIFADPLLEKAFQGLLENSVKHGGHVSEIRVSHTVTSDWATIVFEDNGIGIPHEKKERIFLRGEGALASVRGLYFVQEILSITGIIIRENGEPGKGSRFEMTVPRGAWRMTGKGA